MLGFGAREEAGTGARVFPAVKKFWLRIEDRTLISIPFHEAQFQRLSASLRVCVKTPALTASAGRGSPYLDESPRPETEP
jgi:hypothetical protein